MDVGSALAYVPIAAEPIYCATKAALHSWSQSLRIQLADTNAHVVETLLPTVDTAMADQFDVKKVAPARVAAEIIEAITGRRDEVRFGQAKALYAMSRLAPSLTVRKLNETELHVVDGSPALG